MPGGFASGSPGRRYRRGAGSLARARAGAAASTTVGEEQLSPRGSRGLPGLAELHLVDYPHPHVLATEHLLLGLASGGERSRPVAGQQGLGRGRAGRRNRSAGRPRPRAARIVPRRAAGRCRRRTRLPTRSAQRSPAAGKPSARSAGKPPATGERMQDCRSRGDRPAADSRRGGQSGRRGDSRDRRLRPVCAGRSPPGRRVQVGCATI